MAVISGTDYLNIATAYANAKDTIINAKEYLYDAVYFIVLLNEIKPEVDLLSPFWDSYLINTDKLESTSLFLSGVRAINQHVLIEGNFNTVDAYLQSENIKVPSGWAELSADAGFTIDDSNIA